MLCHNMRATCECQTVVELQLHTVGLMRCACQQQHMPLCSFPQWHHCDIVRLQAHAPGQEVLKSLATFLPHRFPERFQLQGSRLHNLPRHEVFDTDVAPQHALEIASRLVQACALPCRLHACHLDHAMIHACACHAIRAWLQHLKGGCWLIK